MAPVPVVGGGGGELIDLVDSADHQEMDASLQGEVLESLRLDVAGQVFEGRHVSLSEVDNKFFINIIKSFNKCHD